MAHLNLKKGTTVENKKAEDLGKKINSKDENQESVTFCLSQSTFNVIKSIISYQLTFTCSKSTILTLEKGVKYVKS